MPYANITFVKVKMELFEDDRFLIDLNDSQKGLYLMLIGLAGKTNNKIRNDLNFIKSRLNLNSLDQKDLEKISSVFTKFKLKENYWAFDNFEETHNYIFKEFQRNSKGTPKVVQEREEEGEEEREHPHSKQTKFKKPTLDNLKAYFLSLSYPQEAEKFYDYFESNGWKVGGKGPMKDWHAAARGWVKRSLVYNSQFATAKKRFIGVKNE